MPVGRNYTPPLEALNNASSGADRELERIRAFERTIGRFVGTHETEIQLDFNDWVPTNSAIDRVMTYEYPTPPTLRYDPAFSEIDGSPLEGFSPRSARGGKNSRHGVFFGDLHFRNGLDLPVAVKPYEEEDPKKTAWSTLKDYYNGLAVGHIGLYSLQPVGHLLDGSKTGYSITLLEETLTTLDSIDWSNYYPNIGAHPGMSNIWSQIGRQAAMLHSLGANTHWDMAGRNMAETAEDYAFFIDWESSVISPVQPPQAEMRFEFSFPDLKELMRTMCFSPYAQPEAGLGIFHGKNGDLWQAFRDVVFDEYLGVREDMATAAGDKAQRTEVMSELDVLQGSLRNYMREKLEPMLQLPKTDVVNQA